MKKYIPFYIILLFVVVGIIPNKLNAAAVETTAQASTVTRASTYKFHIVQDLCPSSRQLLTQKIKRGLQKSFGGGAELVMLSLAAHLHFVSSRDYAFGNSFSKEYLLHNYPSHHFW